MRKYGSAQLKETNPFVTEQRKLGKHRPNISSGFESKNGKFPRQGQSVQWPETSNGGKERFNK